MARFKVTYVEKQIVTRFGAVEIEADNAEDAKRIADEALEDDVFQNSDMVNTLREDPDCDAEYSIYDRVVEIAGDVEEPDYKLVDGELEWVG
jgi:hypothetical protein